MSETGLEYRCLIIAGVAEGLVPRALGREAPPFPLRSPLHSFVPTRDPTYGTRVHGDEAACA
ncbi:hypothetical protein [Streptomyces massasporeus]|uniref:hypothetical protein n=1 Tax=Streptomyces massasporeus TaxID=67324 RepID=UPI00368D9093